MGILGAAIGFHVITLPMVGVEHHLLAGWWRPTRWKSAVAGFAVLSYSRAWPQALGNHLACWSERRLASRAFDPGCLRSLVSLGMVAG